MQSIRRDYLFQVANETHGSRPRMRLRNIQSKSVNIVLTPDEVVQLMDSLSDCLDEYEESQLGKRKASA